MRVVAFAPIRLNNTRCLGKNVRMIGGRTLLSWATSTVGKLNIENHVYCSNPKIKSLLPDGVKLTIRPESLDEDYVIGLDIYRAFADTVPADAYLLYHVTSPFVNVESYAKGLAVLSDELGYDSAASVTRAQTFAWMNDRPLNFRVPRPRTQELQPVFLENSAFYVYHIEELARGRRTGGFPKFVELSPIEGIDVDTEEDFRLAWAIAEGMKRGL